MERSYGRAATASHILDTGSEMRPTRWHDEGKVQGLARRLGALVSAGLVLALVSGCAQTPPKDRDLNAEAIRQMGYWGGEPGY